MDSTEEESHYLAASTLASNSGSFVLEKPKIEKRLEFWHFINKYGRIISYVTLVSLFTIFFITYITFETLEPRRDGKLAESRQHENSGQILHQIDEINTKIKELQAQNQYLKSENQHFKSDLVHKEAQISQIKEDLSDLKIEFRQANKANSALKLQMSDDIHKLKESFFQIRLDFQTFNSTKREAFNREKEIPSRISSTTLASTTLSTTNPLHQTFNWIQLEAKIDRMNDSLNLLKSKLGTRQLQGFANKTIEDKLIDIKATLDATNKSKEFLIKIHPT